MLSKPGRFCDVVISTRIASTRALKAATSPNALMSSARMNWPVFVALLSSGQVINNAALRRAEKFRLVIYHSIDNLAARWMERR
jgi:hypothetical protein